MPRAKPTHGGKRPGAGRPRKPPGATTAWISAATHATLRAALRPGESRSAFVAAAIEHEATARGTTPEAALDRLDPARSGEE